MSRKETLSPKEVLALCREKDVKAVDLRFCDLLGKWHHKTLPVGAFSETHFSEGISVNGANIRGWQPDHQCDLILIPQEDRTFIDPFTSLPTLTLLCEVFDPVTMEGYSLDPRQVAKKAHAYLLHTGIADQARFGPEAEFYIFDGVSYGQNPVGGYFELDSTEADWHQSRAVAENNSHKIKTGEGNSPVPPEDQQMDLRNAMMQSLIDCGIQVEGHYHESGAAGQTAIDLHHAELLKMADQMMMFKYIVKNVADQNNRSVTFMPKPIYSDYGSGMNVHFSLWKEGAPLFSGSEYAGLSETGLFALGGILRHAPALCAITNPTTNSYKRLVPGFNAPINLSYGKGNRTVACRIPLSRSNPDATRIDVRFPDPSCNPYLAFSAILLAAIDGIQNKIHPGEPVAGNAALVDKNLHHVRQTPEDLNAALNALEKDSQFLMKGEVFNEELIETWINEKRERESNEMRKRPHPYEFCLYYDV